MYLDAPSIALLYSDLRGYDAVETLMALAGKTSDLRISLSKFIRRLWQSCHESERPLNPKNLKH